MANSNTSMPDESTNVKWMYEGTNSSIDREAYLLGKRITKVEEDKGDFIVKDTTNENLSVSVLQRLDYESKVREDPLFSIKKKEEEKRRELLSNPIKRKHIQNVLERALVKDLEKPHKHKKKHHSKKSKHKKKHSRKLSSDSDEDRTSRRSHKLVESANKDDKLHAALKRALEKDLGNEGSLDSSSSDSSDGDSKVKYKHSKSKTMGKNEKKSRSRQQHSDGEEKRKMELAGSHKNNKTEKSKRESTEEEIKRPIPEGYGLIVVKPGEKKVPMERKRRKTPSPEPEKERYQRKHKPGFTRKLDKAELERKRREMMENADWRDDQRQKNIKHYSEKDKLEKQKEEHIQKLHDRQLTKNGKVKTFLHDMKLKRASIGSLEDTVKRKRHTLDRSSKD